MKANLAKKMVLFFVMLYSCATVFATETTDHQLPLQVALKTSGSEVPMYMGDNKPHVSYELWVTNFTKEKINLHELKIRGLDQKGQVVYEKTIDSKKLKPMFRTIGNKFDKLQTPMLGSAQAGTIFVALNFASGKKLPFKLENEISFIAKHNGNSALQKISTQPMSVNEWGGISIASPLRGENWWTPNGPTNDSMHRRALAVLDGRLYMPEKYAVDWVILGKDGKSYKGDSRNNKSYYAYGKKIHAVADGEIIKLKDGLKENIPDSKKLAEILSEETIGGNFILQQIGQNQYAFYAHMIPGSFKVKVGDHVQKGQVLGLLGNSGGSTEPHLHFHLINKPDPLRGVSSPFLIDQFVRKKYQIVENAKGEPIKLNVEGQEIMKNQTFMTDDLGDFGE